MRQYLSPLLHYAKQNRRWKSVFTTVAASSTSLWCMKMWSTSSIRCDNEDKVVNPYPNLPDDKGEDENDDGCVHCRAFLNGPCRALFRNHKYCSDDVEKAKERKESEARDDDDDDDNDNDDDNDARNKSKDARDDDPCLKYMISFQKCLAKYKSLHYLLLAKAKQEMFFDTTKFRELESTALPFAGPLNFDWSQLIHYYNDTGTMLDDLNKSPSVVDYDDDDEQDLHPTLIKVEVEMEAEAEAEPSINQIFYVRDQAGNVLATESPSFVKRKEKSFLVFMVRPFKTRQITLYKFQYSKGDGSEIMFKSETVSLLDVAESHGIPKSIKIAG